MKTARMSVAGVTVGHVTHAEARTGCTVVRFPDATVASGEIRGGSPATREFEMLAPVRRVARLDAAVLSGGSAFGLAAADGVMALLAENQIGHPTPAGVVPIVVGLSLFDLGVGSSSAHPGAADGRTAAESAAAEFAVGPVGAGTGATAGNFAGVDQARPGGLGWATAQHDGVTVSAIIAANPIGDLHDGADPLARAEAVLSRWQPPTTGNTTIGVIVTDAAIDKAGCHLLAQSGHDGLARALSPAHTRFDGDALIAAATGVVPADLDRLRVLAAAVTEAAVRDALTPTPASD